MRFLVARAALTAAASGPMTTAAANRLPNSAAV